MKSKWYISNAFNEKAEMIFENWAKMSIQKVRYKQLKKQATTMKIVDLYFFESLILAQDERWRHA